MERIPKLAHLVTAALMAAALTAPVAASAATMMNSDFQNGVLYWDGSQLVTPVTAGLTGAQTAKALRNFFEKGTVDSDLVDHFRLLGVTSTGYDFLRSRNRLDTIFFDGQVFSEIRDDYALRMSLLFLAPKETDGSTSLRMVATDHSIVIAPDFLESFLISNAELRKSVEGDVPTLPKKLIDLNIPSAVNVLSFKVLSDGGIWLYLQPGGVAPLVALAVQFQLDDLAR